MSKKVDIKIHSGKFCTSENLMLKFKTHVEASVSRTETTRTKTRDQLDADLIFFIS